VRTGKDHSTPAELPAWVKEKRPDYMVPATLVAVRRIPLNANGKVDYAALPTPPPTDVRASKTGVSPRTQLERLIADVWEQVLHTSRVGVEDNFFDLGGHSLLLTQVHGQLKKALGRPLPIVELDRK